MPDFDVDENAVLFFALVVVAIGVAEWVSIFRMGRFGRRTWIQDTVLVLPVVVLLPTRFVLDRFADSEVVGHPAYRVLFLIGALAWLAAAARALPVLGISLRDDAVERSNVAAMLAAIGWLGGIGIVYAAANIGTGPTIWTTLVPAAAGGAGLFVCWLIVDRIGGVAEAITIDRDRATGWRMLGTMIGASLILGNAVAGDWLSWPDTWLDLLHDGWPAAALAIAASVLQRLCRPTPRDPQPGTFHAGLLPAGLIVVVSIAILLITRSLMPSKGW